MCLYLNWVHCVTVSVALPPSYHWAGERYLQVTAGIGRQPLAVQHRAAAI
jgi:hypothetical protein